MTKNINAWKTLLIAISITTTTFFLLSYDLFSILDPFLFLILVIGSIATFMIIISAIITSISCRQFPPKWTFISCIVMIISMPLDYSYKNGFFWGKKIIEAAFLDDISRMDLTLFENGHYLIKSNWLFGEETFTGKYQMKGDTIEFEKYPVIENDAVAKRIIRKNNKIYFNLNNSGNYDTTFYYFKIDIDKHR